MKRTIGILFLAAALTLQTLAASGIYSSSKAEVDASNAAQGYFAARFTADTSKRIKVTVKKGDTTYSYDLNNEGETEVFPLQLGDGKYTVKVLENIADNRYSPVLTASVDVKLDSEFAPYLVPSQMVNYSMESKVAKTAQEITQDSKTELEKVSAIYKYIVANIKYDTDKARTVQSGYLPDVDAILDSNKGICFDYSAVMASMLRSLGIPTKLVTGYVAPKNLYHAWNEVYIKNIGWVKVAGSIYFDGTNWSRMDSTFAAGSSSKKLAEFIGNGSNYSTKYEY